MRVLVVLVLLLAAPASARAYSVLAHQAMIDAVWDAQIAPTLTGTFPHTSAADLLGARAYAYGGSLIQDLGYYPFGSTLFSNLVHYVRSGDFVQALLRESQDVNEYAFALGALAHYASDNAGHPLAVNRAVPMVYPKLREKFGEEVLYAQSPARHVMVEFAFDVAQLARGTFRADVYQDLIGFEVATSVLDRAFRDTYGLSLEDVFGDVDLAVGTYRKAASDLVPDMTRAAWRETRDEILERNPGLTEETFVFGLTRQQYEDTYGTTYRRPGFFARVVVAAFKVLPKFGPFRPLAFEPLTAETEKLFLDSFDASVARYGESLIDARAGRLMLGDTDLDTGERPARGRNELADETFADLVEELTKRNFGGVTPALRAVIDAHFASLALDPVADVFDRFANLAAGAADRFLRFTGHFVDHPFVVKGFVVGEVTHRLLHLAFGGLGFTVEFVFIHRFLRPLRLQGSCPAHAILPRYRWRSGHAQVRHLMRAAAVVGAARVRSGVDGVPERRRRIPRSFPGPADGNADDLEIAGRIPAAGARVCRRQGPRTLRHSCHRLQKR